MQNDVAPDGAWAIIRLNYNDATPTAFAAPAIHVGLSVQRQLNGDMQTKSDADLLREYAVNRSEAAFGEIVQRYADFVYSAALRQVGNAEQARDVAQTVFVDLARKAGSLRANILLIGWLCQGARLAALEQLRKDRRRQQRERQAMDLLDPSPDDPNDWNTVRPALDEAIASLGHEDRDALLLRFFRNESLASVGAMLGVSEDAAQKRVSRALGRLREFLAERGIHTTAAALGRADGQCSSICAGGLCRTPDQRRVGESHGRRRFHRNVSETPALLQHEDYTPDPGPGWRPRRSDRYADQHAAPVARGARFE